MKPYGLLSDSHLHEWNAFSVTGDDLVNNRLQMILDEFWRCASEVKAQGGTTIYHGGDLFHVRGSVTPAVLNTTRAELEDIGDELGIEFRLLPGNHDMTHKHSNRVGNSVEAMRSANVFVSHTTAEYSGVVMVPWMDSVAELKTELLRLAADPSGCHYDLIIHAPIDGVIIGLPDHGITGEWLADLGFKRVFAGHYHNHKEVVAGKVWSIGATTHQTWSDIGTKAGFLIVGETDVKWFSSHAPMFVDITDVMDAAEVSMRCDGNYVRVKVQNAKPSEVGAIRDALMKQGALGVNVNVVKVPTTGRATVSTVKAGSSVEVQVTDYIKSASFEHAELVAQAAINVLAEAV